ncbi:chemotaxis protein CheW [Desulfogranum japonicum]|uniref:chemotaxis protein CheW n=1 Tax=Desulfogranum japonicum TaxID=231447 RepID=UPI0004166AB4|nr:chemotaxis protein CheW [Desulfogranum japonicum]
MEQSQKNQFLTFRIEQEIFGVPIESVREVLDYEPITRIPGTADYMRGIINLRGAVVAVADIKKRFGMQPTAETDNTCIIVLELDMSPEEECVSVGILADQVLEVAEVFSSDMQEHPDLGTAIPAAFLRGLGKVGEQFFMVLDVVGIIDRTLAHNVS